MCVLSNLIHHIVALQAQEVEYSTLDTIFLKRSTDIVCIPVANLANNERTFNFAALEENFPAPQRAGEGGEVNMDQFVGRAAIRSSKHL